MLRSIVTIPTRLRWLGTGGVVALLVGLAFTVGERTATPLVDGGQWAVTGSFQRLVDRFNPLEIPEILSQSPSMARWWSWTPSGGSTGTVTSPPFVAPQYLAVPHHGFPGETPESRIVLRCRATGKELHVARLRTNIQWATAFIEVPTSFCAGESELSASAHHRAFIVGVGTPFAVSRSLFQSHTGFAARALVACATWALLALLFVASAVVVNVRWSPAESVPAGFVGVGIVGMLLFSVFHFSPPAGRATAWVIVLVALAVLQRARWTAPQTLREAWASTRGPLLIWLAAAIVCLAFVSSADSGGGSWAVNGLFSPLRWSTDNQIPSDFAEALYQNTPRETIAWGPWLASDRTPLLAALLLLPRTIVLEGLGFGYGSTFIAVGYSAAAITILASWAAGVAWICRQWTTAALSTVIWLTLTSAFVFFDTVYVWPKLLGATFTLLAFGGLFGLDRERKRSPVTLAVVAGCAALAYLSHSSNAFALLPIAVLFVAVIFRQGPSAIVVATAFAGALLLPWILWQWFVQPGGTALLRQALANEAGFDTRTSPVLPSVLAAYHAMGWDGWLRGKLAALRFVAGIGVDPARLGNVARYSPGLDVYGYLRVLDFFVTLRAIGVAAAGVVLLPALGLFRLDSTAAMLPRNASIAGLAGLLLSIFLTLPIAYMHHQPFGALLLVTVAGAVTLAACGPLASRLAVVVALGYFTVVWIVPPLVIADRVQWTAVAGMAYGAVLLQVTASFAASDGASPQAPGA